jgi:hypothetical protein
VWVALIDIRKIKRFFGLLSFDYIIEVGGPDLSDEICAFFRNNPEKGIRQLPVNEVQQLTDEGLFYVARSAGDRVIVGTLYFKEDSLDAWEMGGALVSRQHRKDQIFACLVVVCLVAQYLKDMVAVGEVGAKKIVARVEKSNKDPINSLKNLHFIELPLIEIDPYGKVGLQDMAKNIRGMVEAREFIFDESFLPKHINRAMEYRDIGILPLNGKTVRIDIPFLLVEEGVDPLKEFLANFRR